MYQMERKKAKKKKTPTQLMTRRSRSQREITAAGIMSRKDTLPEECRRTTPELRDITERIKITM